MLSKVLCIISFYLHTTQTIIKMKLKCLFAVIRYATMCDHDDLNLLVNLLTKRQI